MKQNFFSGTDVLRTVGDLVRWSCSQLTAAGVFYGHGTDNAADEARFLVFHALHLDYQVPDYFYQTRVTTTERDAALQLIQARIEKRIPAPYLTGECWFAGLRFLVDERVLIPRSPIAELVLNRFEPWLANPAPGRILDMCTGSACIAIACSYVFDDAQIDAVDIDSGALEVAKTNVHYHGVADRVALIKSDLFDQLPEQAYDLIVCNPPYVPESSLKVLPAEYAHEPEFALRAADDGLALVHRIVADAARYLTHDGLLVVEVGESMPAAIAAFAHLPISWCDFEQGGEGVFVITAADLRRSISI